MLLDNNNVTNKQTSQLYTKKCSVITTKQKQVINKTTLFTNKIRTKLDNNINTK